MKTLIFLFFTILGALPSFAADRCGPYTLTDVPNSEPRIVRVSGVDYNTSLKIDADYQYASDTLYKKVRADDWGPNGITIVRGPNDDLYHNRPVQLWSY